MYVSSAQMMKLLSKIHPEQLFAGTVLTGAGIGACYGGYHGYLESKYRPFRSNVEGTACGLWFGTIYGGVAGFLWPITVPVVTSVSLSRLLWPATPKTDIYTEHARRKSEHSDT